MIACIFPLRGNSWANGYVESDFASAVWLYVPGEGLPFDWIDGGLFNNPDAALGRPTVDTTGDLLNMPLGEKVPVVPVYSPFRRFELVSIGRGGKLVLEFDHQVADDPNNPHGIDFIIYGNCQLVVESYWDNSDPADFIIPTSGLIEEPAVVSVSQDGVSWYRYEDGPYADSFAPTLGRVYDPCNADIELGPWNLWWGNPTDPTLAMNPSLGPEDMAGLSVAEAAGLYGKAAGGTGFDLASSGMEWIRYVQIETGQGTAEIDAVADAASCGDYRHISPAGDINGDCAVDRLDLALIAGQWLSVACPQTDIFKDGVVNFKDIALMADNWGECSWNCR